MSFIDIDHVRWNEALTNHGPAGVSVLVALAYHAGVNRYGRPWPGLGRLARDSGLHVEQVRRICWDFMKRGLLHDELTDPDDDDPGWFRFSDTETLEDALLEGLDMSEHQPCDYAWRTKAYPDGQLIEGVDPQ